MSRTRYTPDCGIKEFDAIKMLDVAGSQEEKALIAILYLTGMPAKKAITLTADSLVPTEVPYSLSIKWDNESASSPQSIFTDEINLFACKFIPGQFLFPHTTRWVEHVIRRVGNRALARKVTPFFLKRSLEERIAIPQLPEAKPDEVIKEAVRDVDLL